MQSEIKKEHKRRLTELDLKEFCYKKEHERRLTELNLKEMAIILHQKELEEKEIQLETSKEEEISEWKTKYYELYEEVEQHADVRKNVFLRKNKKQNNEC